MKNEISNHGFSREEINSNHEIFLKRNALFEESGINQEKLRRSIVRLIEPGSSSILEIGTGNGYLTSMIAESFNNIATLDIQNSDNRTAMLNAAFFNRLGNIEFINGDAAEMDFQSRSFDSVVSAFTFHHLNLPFKVLKEIARIAERQIVISDFNERGFEAIEKVHLAEGRSHERKPADFSIVGIFLKEFNFDVTVIEEEWQTIYSARRR